MRKRSFWNRLLVGLLLCTLAACFLYIVLGHQLIRAAYESQNLGNVIMPHRDITRLESYYYGADTRMILMTFRGLVAILLAFALLNFPIGLVLASASLLVTSFILFSFFELFPSFIKPLHFDITGYYAYKASYLPDAKLAYIEKPFHTDVTHDFRGHAYSPLYGIDVKPTTVEWKTDGEGFRNSRTLSSADIVVMGDSYIEYGDNEADTFGKRLERHLPRLTVANLGKAGYNPFQYLEVFKRYGLKKQPKYALFCFYEGNDINEMKQYLQWQRGDKNASNLYYTMGSKTFFQRYKIALQEILHLLRATAFNLIQLPLIKILDTQHYIIHPDLALLRLPNGTYHKMLFIPRLSKASPEEMLRSDEWIALKNILMDFKNTSFQHDIVPIVLYIPTPTHIYASYSTKESGNNWLAELNEQVAAKENAHAALQNLVKQTGVPFISLVPVFERQAAAGRLLYYPMDSHWNSEGREVAAQFVADILNTIRSQELTSGMRTILQKLKIQPMANGQGATQ